MEEKKIEVYSEKLGKAVTITETSDRIEDMIVSDYCDSMVGWTHSGWNNDNGGASW